MGKVILTSVHKRRIALAMFALAALMLLDGIYQVGTHVRWRYWIPTTLAAGTATSQPTDTRPTDMQRTDTQPTDTQRTDTQPTETQPTDTQAVTGGRKAPAAKPLQVHAAIKKRNIMAPPMPRRHGMRLTGVLGDSALFTTQKGKPVWIELGKSSQGVKVIAIDGYSVTIEYKGKTQTMKLFPERRGSAPSAPPAGPHAAPHGIGGGGADKAKPPSGSAKTTGKEVPHSQPKGTNP